MKIVLHYRADGVSEKTKEFDVSGNSYVNQFLAGLDQVSYFHNTANTIWRIRGVKDGRECIIGYFVTDRNRNHKYAVAFEDLRFTQLGEDLNASGEQFENLNVDSLEFLKMFNAIKEKDQRNPHNEIKKFDRVISQKAPFGCGYTVVGDEKQYYAWHGLQNRCDSYITTTQISEAEFNEINSEYPTCIDASKEQSSAFRTKYVYAHKVLLEGWNSYI